MKSYDAIVIGGGLLGCFAARNLTRYNLSCALIEAGNDVCTGISKTNTAVVYGSQDNMPGTLKARICKNACDNFGTLCKNLHTEFKRCGSLMVCFGERGLKKLDRCYQRGCENGVENLRMLETDEILSLEPELNPGLFRALYAENTGTVNPWRLCVGAAENAVQNGAEMLFNTPVKSLLYENGLYRVICEGCEFTAKCVVNCAGLNADKLNFTLGVRDVCIVPTRADYIVTGETLGNLISHVIFYETESRGKGITLVPTTEGNLLLGPSELPVEGTPDTEAKADGIEFVRQCAKLVLPDIDLSKTVRAFAGLRPNPFYCDILPDGTPAVSDKSIKDFAIIMPEDRPGYISFAGIKTPGMTCADGLGRLAAKKCAGVLGAGINPAFSPSLPPEPEISGGKIVCRCKKVTEAEIVRAIRANPSAATVDGVKRRTGCGLGECQGSRCTDRIARLISRELNIPLSEVYKGENGSWIMR